MNSAAGRQQAQHCESTRRGSRCVQRAPAREATAASVLQTGRRVPGQSGLRRRNGFLRLAALLRRRRLAGRLVGGRVVTGLAGKDRGQRVALDRLFFENSDLTTRPDLSRWSVSTSSAVWYALSMIWRTSSSISSATFSL